MHQRSGVLFLIVLVAALLLMPAANAQGVRGFVDVQAGDDDSNGVMSCLGPAFIDCSITAAAVVSASYDPPGPPDEIDLSVGAGAVGGFSSVSVDGGSADGTSTLTTPDGTQQDQEILSCDWNGASGGCFDLHTFADFECEAVTAEGIGQIHVVDQSVPVGNLGTVQATVGVPGPAVSITDEPDCFDWINDLIRPNSATADDESAERYPNMTHEEAKELVKEKLDEKINRQISYYGEILPVAQASFMTQTLETLKVNAHETIDATDP